MDIDTAVVLTVMIGLAALGFTMPALMWRGLGTRIDGLGKRIDRLGTRMDRLEKQYEADRIKNEQEHRLIIELLRDHGERSARLENRDEAPAS